MFKLIDNRETLYQWDINVKLIVEDEDIKQVHFSNGLSQGALVCEVMIEEDGKHTVYIPNILLQKSWDIRVFAYKVNHTVEEKNFNVVKREKPTGYVYTETEVLTWEAVLDKVDNSLAENKRQINEAVTTMRQDVYEDVMGALSVWEGGIY